MKITEYIKIYDDVLKKENLDSFFKFAKNNLDYEEARVGDNTLDFTIRKVRQFNLTNCFDQSKTGHHWGIFLSSIVSSCITSYQKEVTPFHGIELRGIQDVNILRYEETDFYKYHTDHAPIAPRTLSAVFFLNDDYEGGELEFAYSNTENKMAVVTPKKNRLVIWPSNFMFPHRVNPVIKGIRYTTVLWAF